MAAARPTGSATMAAKNATSSEPVSNGSTPKFWSMNIGVHCRAVRNSMTETCRKNADDSNTSTATIPTVVRIDTTLHMNSAAPTTRSFLCLRPRSTSRRAARAARDSVAAGTPPDQAQVARVNLRVRRHVPDLRRQLRRLLHVETHETGDFRPVERRAVHDR
jgi:hypothetical protein